MESCKQANGIETHSAINIETNENIYLYKNIEKSNLINGKPIYV